MTSRSKQNGNSNTTLAEQMSQITVKELQAAADDFNPRQSELVKRLFKSISTSCRSLGHTPEAAAFARRCCFSLQDYFGLNSIFLTITPDDELSFRIRLLVCPGEEVRIHNTQTEEYAAFCNIIALVHRLYPAKSSRRKATKTQKPEHRRGLNSERKKRTVRLREVQLSVQSERRSRSRSTKREARDRAQTIFLIGVLGVQA